MWSRREECEFTLVSVTGHSHYVSRHYLDRVFSSVAEVSELRKAESALVMRLLGGRHATLNELDAPLRCHQRDWTLDWYRHHQKSVDACIWHCSNEYEIESWALQIGHLLAATNAQEVWLPLGVGGHTDHELTRNASLRALGRLPGLGHRTALSFYQDVPYSVGFPTHTSEILDALTAAGGTFERQQEDIASVLGDKLRLMSIYESQFRFNDMAAEVELAAQRASPSGNGCCELRFQNDGPSRPGRPARGLLGPTSSRESCDPAGSLVPPSPIGSANKGAFPGWQWGGGQRISRFSWRPSLKRSSKCTSVRQLRRKPSPSRRRGSMSGQLRNPHTLGSGDSLQITIARPCPLIVLTGERRQMAAWVAKVACFRSDPLRATSMNHLVLALRVIRGVTE